MIIRRYERMNLIAYMIAGGIFFRKGGSQRRSIRVRGFIRYIVEGADAMTSDRTAFARDPYFVVSI